DLKRTFIRQLDDRLTARHELAGSTTASYWPLGGGVDLQLRIDGRSDADRRPPVVTMVSVGRRYFATLGLQVRRGRSFIDDDSIPSQAGAIVNQRVADLYFRNE